VQPVGQGTVTWTFQLDSPVVSVSLVVNVAVFGKSCSPQASDPKGPKVRV